jgi:hypothetical protein
MTASPSPPWKVGELARRSGLTVRARIIEVQAEWAEIIPAVQAAMDRGDDPRGPPTGREGTLDLPGAGRPGARRPR